MADHYGEDDLKERCEKLLRVLTTEKSVCEVYATAVHYDSEVSESLKCN